MQRTVLFDGRDTKKKKIGYYGIEEGERRERERKERGREKEDGRKW